MSYAYIYGPFEEQNDYSTMGLVGALMPTEGTFKDVGNGDSMITFTHPLDDFGRYEAIAKGNIIKVPVPVKITPEIKDGKVVTTVWTYKVKPHSQLTSKNQRTLYKKESGSSRIKIMEENDIVTVTEKPEGDNVRWKVKTKYGNGWINPDGFELVTEHLISDNSNSIETTQKSWSLKDQLFRIQEVQKTLTEIKVTARHISYDLLTNKTRFKSTSAIKLQNALNGVLNSCYVEHDFVAYTNVDNEQAGLSYSLKNPIDAFLNPEEGICSLYKVNLVRDNYELYFLKDPGINRGIRIQFKKNMTGINYVETDDEVATRIIPIGETKDGKDLYLSDNVNEHYIDSPLINNYSTIRVSELRCENCRVGSTETNGGTVTIAIARERMRKQAYDFINNGCDKPKINMSVEFINLGDTEEYSQFKDLENCFTFDYLIVQNPKLRIDITSQIMEIEWDWIKDRMKSVQIGSVGKTLANTGITTWQVPSGFSGSKIANETIGGSALMDDIVSVRHLQSGSINTDKLQAGSVNTDKLQAGSVTAEKIEANLIESSSIEAVTGKIEKLTSTDISTDRLAAGLAKFNVVTAGTADFDRATITHLLANSMDINYGIGRQVFIKNLAVLYAQMLGATIQELCIKASNGEYYILDVSEDGTVSATKTTVTDGEIASGQTSGGKVILEANITAENLNTKNLLATYALVNEIDAARIDVDQLFAREAFISLLRTSKIVGDKTITMMVEELENSSRTFRQETFPSGEDNVKVNDLLIIPSNGQTYQAVDMSDINLEFYVDNDGNLCCSMDDESGTYGFEFINHELYSIGFTITIDEDAHWSGPYKWVRVRDQELLDSISNLVDTVDGKTTTFYQDTVPTDAVEKDIWYNTSAGRIYRYEKDSWTDITTNALKAALDAAASAETAAGNAQSTANAAQNTASGAQTAANKAQATADGKIVTFAQATAPTAAAVGDLWIDTDDQNKLYRWNGSSWVPYRDQLILTVQNQAEFATVHDDETPPSSVPEIGKLWLDRSLTPPILRRWLGTGTDTTDMANWEIVNDTATIESAQAAIAVKQAALEAEQRNVATFLKLDFDTVRIGKEGVTSEFQIDPWGSGVAVKGKVFSRFEADRVRFGNMEIRRPNTAGGLMLDAIDSATGVSM